jgi:hypothetical protein
MGTSEKSFLTRLSFVVLATTCWSTSGIFINWVVNGSGISAVGLAFWLDLEMGSPATLAMRGHVPLRWAG